MLAIVISAHHRVLSVLAHILVFTSLVINSKFPSVINRVVLTLTLPGHPQMRMAALTKLLKVPTSCSPKGSSLDSLSYGHSSYRDIESSLFLKKRSCSFCTGSYSMNVSIPASQTYTCLLLPELISIAYKELTSLSKTYIYTKASFV